MIMDAVLSFGCGILCSRARVCIHALAHFLAVVVARGRRVVYSRVAFALATTASNLSGCHLSRGLDAPRLWHLLRNS